MRRKEESERKEGCKPNIHSLGVVRRSFWKRACVGVDNLGIASGVELPHKAEGYRGPPRAQPVTIISISSALTNLVRTSHEAHEYLLCSLVMKNYPNHL